MKYIEVGRRFRLMDQDYTAPHKALQKLKAARKLCHTVYLYGATGYGKTELVKQYLSNRRYGYLSCASNCCIGCSKRSVPFRFTFT